MKKDSILKGSGVVLLQFLHQLEELRLQVT